MQHLQSSAKCRLKILHDYNDNNNKETQSSTYRATHIANNILVVFDAEAINSTNGLLQVGMTLHLKHFHHQLHRRLINFLITFTIMIIKTSCWLSVHCTCTADVSHVQSDIMTGI